jgi:2-desacetyl-2-hydroxyethyl bacteriochlorophyllide A dehydrogenase
MRAAVFEGNGRLVVRDIPTPDPGAGEVLVEVEACGICGSDVQIVNVPPGHPSSPPVVLGHEFVGRVRALGEGVTGFEIGSRVVVDPDPKCGACTSCRAGRPANCSNIVALGVHRDGALAEYVTTPANTVYAISETVPAELAALVEPLACVVNGTNRAAVRPGETVVVFGAGAIGCLFIGVFEAAGAGRIIAIEPSTQRAPIARAMGADEVLTPDEWADRRVELVADGADVVVDAVGSVLPQAINAAAMGGRVIVFGMNDNARAPLHQIEITEKGLSIFGSYISNFTFPTSIRLVEGGALRLEPMLTHVLPLERLTEGLDLLRSGAATKVVVTPA